MELDLSAKKLASKKLINIVEAILLASSKPLNLKDLAEILSPEHPTLNELKAALAQLAELSQNRSLELVATASGYRYQIKAKYAPWISRLWEEKPPRYSRALLETLALIAYKQPITRGEIEEVRGVSLSTQIMRNLEDRDWIRIVGHREVPGRPALYATTRHFLDYFNLASLNELPELDALSEFAQSLEQEWQDELDIAPVSPLLTADSEQETEAAENPNKPEDTEAAEDLDDILTAPLPEVSELTFADLAARFQQPEATAKEAAPELETTPNPKET